MSPSDGADQPVHGRPTRPSPVSDAVVAAIEQSRQLGFLGSAPTAQIVDHSLLFEPPLRSLVPGSTVCDLGSGGGVPALVLAHVRHDLVFTLVDRRRKRTDFLTRMVSRLGLSNVLVRNADVNELARSVRSGAEPPWDAITARGFGPPELFLRSADALLAPDGFAVISEPPTGSRWKPDVLAAHGLRSIDGACPPESGEGGALSRRFTGGVRVLGRVGE